MVREGIGLAALVVMCASTHAVASAVDAGPEHQRSQRRQLQLLPRSQPGAELHSNSLVVLEKIGKQPGDNVTVPDVHAANKWLCEAAGGTLDDEYRCSEKRVFRFENKDALQDLKAHRSATRSVFRAPGVHSVAGPRGASRPRAC